jgi:hypothetical protein
MTARDGSGRLDPSPYAGRSAAIATMHGKDRALRLPLRLGLGLEVVAANVDTDALGTFSGEVPRDGSPLEVARRKARLGLDAARLPLGLATEGSFGPHPHVAWVPLHHELLLFVDLERGLEVVEALADTDTNHAQVELAHPRELEGFLATARFPSHALIVYPAGGLELARSRRA